jgi:diguanylate cyclase (GGDEF)-like protein
VVTKGFPVPNQERLLVVDDDPMNADMLSRRLQRCGYDVMTAASGPEALALLDSTAFDLVLLDKAMQGMDGMEVLRRVREDGTLAQIPVIMATAETHSGSIAAALEAGANDYLTKPIDFTVALARIQSQLSRHKAHLTSQWEGERYRLALEGTKDVIFDWRPPTGELFLSSAWEQMTGVIHGGGKYSLSDWLDLVHPGDVHSLREALNDHCIGRSSQFFNEHRMVAGGQIRWIRASGLAARSPSNRVLRVTGTLRDITDHKAADGLTGLPNRLHFLEQISRAIESVRGTGRIFALLFMDLDRFKQVNDSLGHLAGDQLLVEVAQRLRCRLPGHDQALSGPDHAKIAGAQATMARLGGDEFVILTEGIQRAEDAVMIAERLLEDLALPFDVSGQRIYVSGSIGVAVWSSQYHSAYELLRDADTAMYRAKGKGKNRAELFTESLRAEAVFRLQFESDLRRATGHKQFTLAWQPIVDLRNGCPVAVEVLLRWPTFGLGECRIEEVIRIAEETGLIFDLGGWVLEEACRLAARLQELFPRQPPLGIHINVSGKQVLGCDLYQVVQSALENSGLNARSLRLEVTESTLLANTSAVLDVFQRLKCSGVEISIDDFGTGFSSLSYLHKFPFDTLKLDRSFLQRKGSRGTHIEIVRAVVQLSHALGMEVIAEGVEDDQQASILRDLGCEYAQGFLFARPMNWEGICQYLRDSACAAGGETAEGE